MDQVLSSRKRGKPRVLVAPLDWGLGHATRCIPIIRELQQQGAEPVLAGEGIQKELLETEFPGIEFLPLMGYRVTYSRGRTGMPWKIISQLRKINNAIHQEQRWLKEVVISKGLDAVISDNRYGLYYAGIPTVFITHQLHIRTGSKWLDGVMMKKNFRYIERFDQCWIPDIARAPGVAGELSHPQKMPASPVHYVGPLSRFIRNGVEEKNGQLLILLSGPEPQRSVFEKMVIDQASRYNGYINIVRGLPGNKMVIPSTNMIKCYNHLPTAELNEMMEESEYIISRSGYSTVMDAIKLKKKCIFIPTPGQTEQEYLGKFLMERNIAYTCSQKDFDLDNCLERARRFDYNLPGFDQDAIKDRVRELMASL